MYFEKIAVLKFHEIIFTATGDVNTKICGGAKMHCLEKARKQFWATHKGQAVRDKCNCLPSCVHIKYSTKFLRNKLDMKSYDKFYQRK